MSTNNRLAIGMDVSDRTASVCVMDCSGILEEFKIPLDVASFRTRVPFVAPEHGVVVFETGPRSAWMKREFTRLGMRCVVADARKLKAIASSPTKTDRNDARVLARLGLADELVGALGTNAERLLCDTYVRPPELQRVYERLTIRDQLVHRRGDLIRQVRTAVKGTGRTLRGGPASSFHLRQAEVGDELQEIVEPLFDVIAACTEAIRKIEGRLEQLVAGSAEVQLLKQVDGVGTITALAFFAVVGDPTRFGNVRDVGAYLGLVVRRDQSGRMDPALGISRCGNGFMRRLLVQCATYILGPFGKECALRAWGLKYITEKGDRAKKKARVAIARKLAVQLLSIWKNKTDWKAFPGLVTEAEAPSATVGSDDCVYPLVPIEHVNCEIAAPQTAPIQPCARPGRTRTDESAESRGGPRPEASVKSREVGVKPNAGPGSRQGPATPSARASLACAGDPASPCLPPAPRVPRQKAGSGKAQTCLVLGRVSERRDNVGSTRKKSAPPCLDEGAAS